MSNHDKYDEASYPEVEPLAASARKQLLPKGVRSYGEGENVNVLIEDDVIAEVGENLTAEDRVEVLGFDSLVLLPGLVGIHIYLRESSHEDTETLTTGFATIVRGGFTVVFTMANTAPVTDDPPIAELVWPKGQTLNLYDVHPAGSITRGLEGKTLTEPDMMADLQTKVCVFSGDGKRVNGPLITRRAVEYAHGEDVLLAQHCEGPRLTADASAHEGPIAAHLGLTGWPHVAKESIVTRDATMARGYDGHVHICHVSAESAVELVKWAEEHDIPLTVEVTPYHLILTDEKLETYDGVYHVNPPLREQHDTLALRQALIGGVIDCVVTDHAPCGSEEKCRESEYAKPGMPGLETSMPIIVEKFVLKDDYDWRWLAKVTSGRPAQVVRPPGHGRPIAVDEPADLTVVDPGKKWTVYGEDLASKSENTPYGETEMAVSVAATALHGRVTALNGKVAG